MSMQACLHWRGSRVWPARVWPASSFGEYLRAVWPERLESVGTSEQFGRNLLVSRNGFWDRYQIPPRSYQLTSATVTSWISDKDNYCGRSPRSLGDHIWSETKTVHRRTISVSSYIWFARLQPTAPPPTAKHIEIASRGGLDGAPSRPLPASL